MIQKVLSFCIELKQGIPLIKAFPVLYFYSVVFALNLIHDEVLFS